MKKKHERRHSNKYNKTNVRSEFYAGSHTFKEHAGQKETAHNFAVQASSEVNAISPPFLMSEAGGDLFVDHRPDSSNNSPKINKLLRREKALDQIGSQSTVNDEDKELRTAMNEEYIIAGMQQIRNKRKAQQPLIQSEGARMERQNREKPRRHILSEESNYGGGNSVAVKIPNSDTFFPSIQWLLNDPLSISPKGGRSSYQLENGAFYTHNDGPLGPSTLAMLEEIFALSPEFPHADCQTEVDDEILLKMVKCIPAIQEHPDFVIDKIKWFLEIYWLLYHCQHPILHRLSFSTFETQPLLLLNMIMIGASFSKKSTPPEHFILADPNGLADMIADPLRWLIFTSEQAKPPCKSWVIQSLIILETFEITSTSRTLHERACIYNGAKVQLLRRSPILGGDPLISVGSDVSHSNSLWNTWIESQSMKRIALMSFYIDTVHAIVYGHPVNLFANQVKLSLPCPDDLWEYNNIDRNKAPMSVAQTPLFCDALRKLLQKERVDVEPFSSQILLAGLINLLLQVEQNISQWSNFGWESIQENWRDTISSAIEYWKTQLPSGNCCLTSSSMHHYDTTSLDQPPLPPFLKLDDTRCSFPVYHAAQIYLRITHYDYIVYAGAPRRMNVPILPDDYEIVVKQIGKWVKSSCGPLCVIHSIIYLCEILLSPEDSLEMVNYFYEPDKDPYLYRPNIVISAILSQ